MPLTPQTTLTTPNRAIDPLKVPGWIQDCGVNPTLHDLLDAIDQWSVDIAITTEKAINSRTYIVGPDESNVSDPSYKTDGVADYVQIAQALLDIGAAGGGKVSLVAGIFDVEQVYPGALRIPSNTVFEGAGIATILNTDAIEALFTSTLGTEAGADHVHISDLCVDGNSDNLAPGDRSGHNISIDGSGPANMALDCSVTRCVAISGSNAFRSQYAKRTNIQNCISIDSEHGFYLYRGEDYNLTNIFSFAENYGTHLAFMQRGMFINQMKGVNVTNFKGKDMYAVGVFIRAYNVGEPGQVADSPICRDINLANTNIYTTSTVQTMTGGITVLTSDTHGVENLNYMGGNIDVGRGPAISFLRGPNDGVGGSPINEIPIKNVQVTGMTFRQRTMGVSTYQSTLAFYGYRDDVGSFEPNYFAVDNLTFVNCKFFGVQPANTRWVKNIKFIGCHFEVDTGVNTYASLSFRNCQDITLLGNTFKSLNGGFDLDIDNTNTGTLIMAGNKGLTGLSTIDDSGFTNTEYGLNEGFSDIHFTSVKYKTVIIESPELLNLSVVVKEMIAAQGVGKTVELVGDTYAYFLHNTIAYGATAGKTLVLRYANTAGYYTRQVAATGLLSVAASNTKRFFDVPPSATPVVVDVLVPQPNQPIVAHMLGGNVTLGNGRVRIDMLYRIRS